jgi:phage tail-like protein
MPDRDVPYGSFRFNVDVDGVLVGGFSEVTGLGTEVTVAEYRNGNERTTYTHKVPGLHKVTDVTLKRGVIDSRSVWQWIEELRTRGHAARRSVRISLLDEEFNPVQQWRLVNAIPTKYTGPSLNAKGGTDVAMEELVLAYEDLQLAD